jgi:hypothetical protein
VHRQQGVLQTGPWTRCERRLRARIPSPACKHPDFAPPRVGERRFARCCPIGQSRNNPRKSDSARGAGFENTLAGSRPITHPAAWLSTNAQGATASIDRPPSAPSLDVDEPTDFRRAALLVVVEFKDGLDIERCRMKSLPQSQFFPLSCQQRRWARAQVAQRTLCEVQPQELPMLTRTVDRRSKAAIPNFRGTEPTRHLRYRHATHGTACHHEHHFRMPRPTERASGSLQPRSCMQQVGHRRHHFSSC